MSASSDTEQMVPTGYWMDLIALACIPAVIFGGSGLTLLFGGTP